MPEKSIIESLFPSPRYWPSLHTHTHLHIYIHMHTVHTIINNTEHMNFKYNSIFRAETEKRIANESRRKQITCEISTNNALSILHIIYTHDNTKALTLFFFIFGLFISLPTKSNQFYNQLHKFNRFTINTIVSIARPTNKRLRYHLFDYKTKIVFTFFAFMNKT